MAKPVKRKVVKCPKCGNNIDYLIARVVEENLYNSTSGGLEDFRDQVEAITKYYICPECHQELPIDDADDFLAGGDEWKKVMVGESYSGEELFKLLHIKPSTDPLYALRNNNQIVVAEDEGNDTFKVIQIIEEGA